ncbi:hypothetical protein ACVH9Z_15450 [Rhodococcus opacus]|uniref:hypothetical protein n=1 Tax=Rhodococcus opacus TaxID=37919 RepID=UPI00146B98C6|nr:hypothetical protein [Rhodococcus opacus]MDJ0419626.1 hypothetical protein [Rhodococcus opacus]MDV7088212.1 hypothetical protein [Rhodococcus opacus]WKN52580.1 hypothetical protein HJ581_0001275 [Rhodococcus opacus]
MTSLADRVYLMASGKAMTPATEGPAEIRWNWFADLYDNPRWGLSTIPSFPASAAHTVAELCRATSTDPTADADVVADQVNALKARWQAIDRLAAIKGGRAQSEAADYAWAAVAASSVDAYDYLAGVEFSGTETVSCAFWAQLAAQPSDVAEVRINAAINAWELRRCQGPTTGVAA